MTADWRRAVAPAWSDERIVALDERVLVVDKPAGVPTQRGGAPVPDDVVSRARAHLGEAAGPLGAHAQLDRDGSGLYVLGRTADANRRLAHAFERGGARRWWTVASVDAVGGRRLGRYGPTRAHAAAVRARSDGGARVVAVHLEELAIDGLGHWRTPVPTLLEDWVRWGHAWPEDPGAVARRVGAAVERRYGWVHADRAREPVTAFRLIDPDRDGLPGTTVEVFGDHAVLWRIEGPLPRCWDALLDVLERMGLASVHVKVRPRQRQRLEPSSWMRLAPRTPARGRAPAGEVEVLEHGLRFGVRLDEGFHTGLFLDQRDNRARVRAWADGARVLNLFAYTGSFTVAAAAGGAARTVSVDASAPALERARDTLERTGFGGDRHELVRGEVFEVLRTLARRGDRFDLVVCDPPTYATVGSVRWRGGRQWIELLEGCLVVLRPGGLLLATSNDGRLDGERLAEHARRAAERAGVRLGRVRRWRPPDDFGERALSTVEIALELQSTRPVRIRRGADGGRATRRAGRVPRPRTSPR
ncbi:MAG: class I SAM-dependent methyltransferase [Myxococcota bacterium]|nr:class I SAM-dependent methyltransferase [Myxococcota bacterium]